MPTAQVCAKFEQLQTAIITLLDLKRQVDRQETDLKVKKTQKTKDGTPTPQGPQEGIANRVSSRAQVIAVYFSFLLTVISPICVGFRNDPHRMLVLTRATRGKKHNVCT